MARGYHGATLEQIAEEAGFSKGVVYSQFESKSDLFMSLLEERIAERARENAEVAQEHSGASGLAALLDHIVRVGRSEPEWGLLVIEFRVHAARDPELNRRYSAAHARTIASGAEAFAAVYDRVGEEPPFPPRQLAEIALAIGAGAQLEQAADPGALQGPLVAHLLSSLLIRYGAMPADSVPEPRSLS